MKAGLAQHCRGLSRDCRIDALMMRCGATIAAIACMGCIYLSHPGYAIVMAVFACLLEFIAATLRYDAAVLQKLAESYEDTDPDHCP